MPLTDEYGGHRPGDNLFGNSIVAIDVKTGLRKWHYQFVHHDIWDYDMPMAPNLLDVTVNGRPRKIIASTTKQGWVYTLDRVTGEPIWPIVETPVLQSEVPGEQTSPTQPIPSQARAVLAAGLARSRISSTTRRRSRTRRSSSRRSAAWDRTSFRRRRPTARARTGPSQYTCSWYAPGASGGVNIDGGAAADPETGMIYVGGQSGMSTIAVGQGSVLGARLHVAARQLRQARRAAAAAGIHAAADRGRARRWIRARRRRHTAIGGVSILKPKEMGGITAYDMNTGDKKWWVPNGNALARADDERSALRRRDAAEDSGGRRPAGSDHDEDARHLRHGSRRWRRWRRRRSRRSRRRAAAAAVRRRAGPQLYAFDKATGKQVGAVTIPAVNTAVPMTFLHQGKQYIVFATGAGEPSGSSR